MVKAGKLTPEFQTELLKAILQDHSFLKQHRKILHEDQFQDHNERSLSSHVFDYYDKYKSTPDKGILFDYLGKNGYDIEDLDESTEYLYKPARNITYISDSIKEFVKVSALRDALIESMDLLNDGNYDAINTTIRQASNKYEEMDDIGEMFFDDVKSILTSMDDTRQAIPTGIVELDDFMSGGGQRGTLNLIVTPPNKGKSTTLINFGKQAVFAGYKVAHYSLELSAEIIKRRYLMSMTKSTKAMLRKKKRTVYSKFLEMSQGLVKDSLIIKRFRAGTCTCEMLESHLNLIKDTCGFFPDRVIIDYADNMKASKAYNEKRHELQNIFLGLREIAYIYNCDLWTASQTNRTGEEVKLITMKELSEDYGKAFIADVIVTVNQTLEEMRRNEARLFIAKNRDDASLETVPINTHWDKAFISGID